MAAKISFQSNLEFTVDRSNLKNTLNYILYITELVSFVDKNIYFYNNIIVLLRLKEFNWFVHAMYNFFYVFDLSTV